VNENSVAREIVDAAFQIHVALGPGLLETIYEVVLTKELEKRGLRVDRQKGIPVAYQDIEFSIGSRADLIVEDLVIVEVKSVDAIAPVHRMQLLTYLRFADKRLGLLINFNVPWIKNGISRVVNGLSE
jgi:GxxExxY protein